MRKSFLLLFLLALLPMAGWAAEGDTTIKLVTDAGEVPETGSLTGSLAYSETGYQFNVYRENKQGHLGLVENPTWAYSEDGEIFSTVAGIPSFKTAGYYMARGGNGDKDSWSSAIQILPKTTQQGDDPGTPVVTPLYQEVQVQPISGVNMVYGGKIDLSENNAKNVISLVGLELNSEEDALKKAIIGLLKVNEEESLKTKRAGTTQTYSLGLKNEANCYVELGDITYKISPILDAQVNIVKGTNELEGIDNQLLLSVKQNLPYNGEPQELVEVPKGASLYPGIEYLMVPAANWEAFRTALREAIPQGTAGRPGRFAQAQEWNISALAADFEFPLGYKWQIEIPEGKDVGRKNRE